MRQGREYVPTYRAAQGVAISMLTTPKFGVSDDHTRSRPTTEAGLSELRLHLRMKRVPPRVEAGLSWSADPIGRCVYAKPLNDARYAFASVSALKNTIKHSSPQSYALYCVTFSTN